MNVNDDGAFSKFLKEVVASGLDFGESPEPDWTKEKRALFISRLRSAHATISYAIARCVANALIYGLKTTARPDSHGTLCVRLSA